MRAHRWLLTALAAVLLPASAHADGDGERAALARRVHEIAALEPLVREAERQADPDARIRFQYPWLCRDLGQIRSAIEEHIAAPQTEPRKVAPLLGDYRR
jgi:RAQPRD family integrative conjugative element protein